MMGRFVYIYELTFTESGFYSEPLRWPPSKDNRKMFAGAERLAVFDHHCIVLPK
jgi:hypothetical protein